MKRAGRLVFALTSAAALFFLLGLPSEIADVRVIIDWAHPLLRRDPAGTQYHAYLPTVQSPLADQRFGVVGVGLDGPHRKPILDSLRVSSYYLYEWGELAPDRDTIQMVGRDYIGENGLEDFIRSHPGLYWQIGNEPNVPNQDNLSPADYAQKHRYWTKRIKAIDPSAKILNGGIANWPDVVGVSGAAVSYIKEFRESYWMMFGEYPQVDVWSIHAYPPFRYVDGQRRSICDTAAPKRFIQEAAEYLRGVGEYGPIWLTEFGMEWGDDSDECMGRFMTDMVHWLKQTDYVSRWYWFAVNPREDGFGGALVDLDGNLTNLGKRYRELVAEGT